MWEIEPSEWLPGGELNAGEGERPSSIEQVDEVWCAACDYTFMPDDEYTSHRYYPTIQCFRCAGIIAIQYGDAPYRYPWEILELSGVSASGVLEVEGSSYSVFEDATDELSSIHRAGECLARATSSEFPSDGRYNIGAMNVVVVAEPGNTAVGYVTWNTFDSETSTYPALRQLYLLPEYRRQGLGSALVQYWLDEVVNGYVADTPQQVFCVESPNGNMKALLRSSGYDGESGGPSASFYTPGQM